MDAADVKQLVYRVYDAINRRDLPELEALFDPHVIRHAAGEVGFEHARRAVLNLDTAGAPPRLEVADVLAEGDRAALRVLVHREPHEPGTPTPIILEIFRVEHGRVAEIWGAGSQQIPRS
jgi:predicted SnoaL-like aldol condensation-catalyzing enzyme